MSFHKSRKESEVSKMPPLYHKLPGEDFDVKKSEVVKWLSTKPQLIDYVFSRLRKSSNDLIYNPTTGKWQGVDFEGDEE